MQRRNLIVLGVAVLIGLIAVYLLNVYFSGVERREVEAVQSEGLTKIVVASQPLDFGTPLTTANIRLASWPANSIPAGSFDSIETALQDGRVALRPIIVGEPILAERVSGPEGRASISYAIPEGMRAVAVPVSAVSSVSGFVRPGDVVDVLLTRPAPGGSEVLMTDVLLSNVQVVAVDQDPNIKNTGPQVGKTAVLMVDLVGAQALTLARDIGTLSLVLRNIKDDQFKDTRLAGARPYVTARDINRNRPVIGAPAGRGRPTSPANILPGPSSPKGPSMIIVRGTEPTQYQVRNYGSW